VRRHGFEVRAKAAAVRVGADVTLEVHPDAEVGDVVVDVRPGTRTTIRIDAGARVGDGVKLSLRGGTLHVGAGTDVRRLGTMHIGGDVRIGSGCVVSTGVCIHCAESVELGDLSIVGEYTTIADSAHVRTPPGVPVHHSVRTRPVSIGRNVWVGAHAVIASGATVGDQCFVGAGAVVTGDVPEGWLAAGVPARLIRELEVVDPVQSPGDDA
jgi:acetyltransferase-like isoleucine patch superfamily enzyme